MKLDEIEKLIEAASPGPWEHRDNCEVMTTEMLRHCVASCGPKRDFSFGNSSSMANAAFIAASRTLMPKLLKVSAAAKLWLSVADIYSQHRVSADRQVYKLDYMQGREIFRDALEELEQA